MSSPRDPALPLEVAGLFEQLRSLCAVGCGGEPERQAAFRLLHSLKSYAALQGLAEAEQALHDLEEGVRSSGPLGAEAARRIGGRLDALAAAFAAAPVPPPPVPAGGGARLRGLALPPVALGERQVAQIRDLQAEGREMRVLRVWISDQETMPVTRILLLLSILENQSLLHAEAWLWQGASVFGAYDTRDWARQAASSPSGLPVGVDPAWRGALLRVVLGRRDRGADYAERLWIDHVEAIHESGLAHASRPDRLLRAAAGPGTALGAGRRAAQELLFHQRRFTPGPRGLGADALLAFEHAWKEQTDGLADLDGQPVADALWTLFVQSGAGPGAAADGERAAVEWRLACDDLRQPAEVVAALRGIVLQLVRNSLAHARQGADRRTAQHKPAGLLIRCAVMEEDGQVVLHYSDDGPGLDREAIARRAGRELDALVDDAELWSLVGGEGFSTSPPGLDAGRGMGLAVARHLAANCLRGGLAPLNRPGRGCSFTVRYPRSLLPVAVEVYRGFGGDLAIPAVWIAGTVALGPGSVDHQSGGDQFFRYAGRALPFLCCPGLASPGQLEGALGVLLRRDGVLAGVVPATKLLAAETVLIEAESTSVYVAALQGWVNLGGLEA